LPDAGRLSQGSIPAPLPCIRETRPGHRRPPGPGAPSVGGGCRLGRDRGARLFSRRRSAKGGGYGRPRLVGAPRPRAAGPAAPDGAALPAVLFARPGARVPRTPEPAGSHARAAPTLSPSETPLLL